MQQVGKHIFDALISAGLSLGIGFLIIFLLATKIFTGGYPFGLVLFFPPLVFGLFFPIYFIIRTGILYKWKAIQIIIAIIILFILFKVFFPS